MGFVEMCEAHLVPIPPHKNDYCEGGEQIDDLNKDEDHIPNYRRVNQE